METPNENSLIVREITRRLAAGEIDEPAARTEWTALGVPADYQDELVLLAAGGGDHVEIEQPEA